jgi:hypothetical protein
MMFCLPGTAGEPTWHITAVWVAPTSFVGTHNLSHLTIGLTAQMFSGHLRQVVCSNTHSVRVVLLRILKVRCVAASHEMCRIR